MSQQQPIVNVIPPTIPPAVPVLTPGSILTQKTYQINEDGTTSGTTILTTSYHEPTNTLIPTTYHEPVSVMPEANGNVKVNVSDAKPRLSQSSNVSKFVEEEIKVAKSGVDPSRVTIESHSSVGKAMTKKNWQGKLARVLESHGAHIFILLITFLDLISTIVEMSVELLTNSNCPVCEHPPFEPAEPETLLEVLHWISTTCLLIMCVDLFLRLLAFGPMYFLGSFLHFFDAVVVIAATALDFALRSQDGEAVAGLLVALRFWRIIRVVDSVAMSTKERADAEIEKYKEELKETYEQEDKLRAALMLYQDRVHFLENSFHVDAKQMMTAQGYVAPIPPTLTHPFLENQEHQKQTHK